MDIPILVFSAFPESLKIMIVIVQLALLKRPFELKQLIEKITSVLILAKGEPILD
ncbi:MAG TPA: hypothetical protein VGP55_03260 [Chitinophagaceae bacterium]|nr:hypothetical protein [Chitinophagaceae bacterium]